MIEKIGSPAMLEQLAEEATELAHAALKLARIERGENPTPVLKDAAVSHLIEEYTDVVQCAEELSLVPNMEQIRLKKMRFEERWKEELYGKYTFRIPIPIGHPIYEVNNGHIEEHEVIGYRIGRMMGEDQEDYEEDYGDYDGWRIEYGRDGIEGSSPISAIGNYLFSKCPNMEGKGDGE